LSNSVRHCRIPAVKENDRPRVVIVSHSAEIAAGLADLVGQVAGSEVPIVTAGGTVDGSLGTDGGRVLALLREAAADGGAVVLVDLGSSVLSVRAALAELDDKELERISVADAPLVEGAVAAGVALSTGCTHAEAARAAEEARRAGKL
jgi:phosphoenolpyruvate---glycerone phosphotransferase subunit DhaM